MSLKEFQSRIGYKFNESQLLETALTHSSYANENKASGVLCNERLEFLGDSVLNLIVTNHVFVNFSDLAEGEMTRTRAGVVCEQALKDAAVEMGIGNLLRLGKGEEITGGRSRPSILADAFEALVGAIYIDGGFEQAQKFVLSQLGDLIESSVSGTGPSDYKTRLQEILQRNGDAKIDYLVVKQIGPDHDKEFHIEVRYDGKVLGTGRGKSKKEAEQTAAKKALNFLGC